jgi:hypothetical protein
MVEKRNVKTKLVIHTRNTAVCKEIFCTFDEIPRYPQNFTSGTKNEYI